MVFRHLFFAYDVAEVSRACARDLSSPNSRVGGRTAQWELRSLIAPIRANLLWASTRLHSRINTLLTLTYDTYGIVLPFEASLLNDKHGK